MTNNDLKFFTNEPERDLYSRFATILKSNTQFFDVLVGYFRTSGFFRMHKAMAVVDKIRILVGLNVDRYTVKLIDRVKEEIKYRDCGSCMEHHHGADSARETGCELYLAVRPVYGDHSFPSAKEERR